jgi:hypothetical protein
MSNSDDPIIFFVEGLTKRYRGADRNAVDGVSFTPDRIRRAGDHRGCAARVAMTHRLPDPSGTSARRGPITYTHDGTGSHPWLARIDCERGVVYRYGHPHGSPSADGIAYAGPPARRGTPPRSPTDSRRRPPRTFRSSGSAFTCDGGGGGSGECVSDADCPLRSVRDVGADSGAGGHPCPWPCPASRNGAGWRRRGATAAGLAIAAGGDGRGAGGRHPDPGGTFVQ